MDSYTNMKRQFIQEYDAAVRQWLRDKQTDEEIAEMVPFFEDGIVCPKVWFSENNGFRPLFVLKEASIGVNDKSELRAYHEHWNGNTRFDHVGGKFDDVRIGVNRFNGNNPWMRIVKLAYGLKAAYDTRSHLAYDDIVDIAFIQGEENQNNIGGDSCYQYATANPYYISMVNQIAVVNIKKIGGGTTANSELSIATRHYSEHLERPLGSLLFKQITELIKPTVIIYCSPDIAYLMKKTFNGDLDEKYISIRGYHPTRNSTKNFYDKTITQYLEKLDKA